MKAAPRSSAAGLTAERALAMDDAELHYHVLLGQQRARAKLLKAAKGGATPSSAARGVVGAREFRRSTLFGRLDLVDGPFCAACVAAYGGRRLAKGEFLTCPSDAVVLAGSPASAYDGAGRGHSCWSMRADHPRMAHEVLAQTMPRGARLGRRAADAARDASAAARAAATSVGYARDSLAAQTCASEAELNALGF